LFSTFFVSLSSAIYIMKYLIVGLGNIGEEYKNTRHNIGFKILDSLAKKNDLSFASDRLGNVARLKFKGRTLILVKPTTFMNLSGKAVNYWLQTEKINVENLLIVTDDIALPFGSLRMKPKGSDGGHNGLKNIQETLNSSEYPRLRFGIGSEFNKGSQVNYVLGEWDEHEKKELDLRIDKAGEMIKSFATVGLQPTMNLFNNK
jgi:PTH1 family peptidyl-tRNA hydrolase